jgi:hypothetical protein
MPLTVEDRLECKITRICLAPWIKESAKKSGVAI